MPPLPFGAPKRFLSICLLFCSLALTACSALSGSTAFYSFGFDATAHSPGVVVLDYRYSSGDRVIRGLSRESKNDPKFKGVYQGSIGGHLRIGDKLYVKWKEIDSGVVREVTADLANRLPSSMEDKNLYFVIGAETVHVYVADIKSVIPNDCVRIRKERALNPKNPDSIARGYFCTSQLDKIYPETKNLNNYRQKREPASAP
ncbi:MAG: hypothetical protein WBJ19_00785 [Rhodoferax sp.]